MQNTKKYLITLVYKQSTSETKVLKLFLVQGANKEKISQALIGYGFQDTVLCQNRKFMQNKVKTVVYQKVQCIYKQPILFESLSAHSNTFFLICLEF